MDKQREIQKTLQILLWLWFGLVNSFIATNVVNIAKLETQIKILENSAKMSNNDIEFYQRCLRNK